MLDTGATHNFSSVEEAQRLGLKGNNGGGSIKAVNSPTRPIHDIVRGVKTSVGAWCGNLDFSIVPMDDFKVWGWNSTIKLRQSQCHLPIAFAGLY